jgi:hypothetical protein
MPTTYFSDADVGLAPQPQRFLSDADVGLAPPKPAFGSDEYIDALAKKHDVSTKHVRALTDSYSSTEALKGVPIAGGLFDKASAGVSALAQPLTGAGASGGSIGERYSKNLALERELAADFERENPYLSTALQLGGGLVSTSGLGATTAGARALGMVEGGLGRQMGASALSGAGIGAADALARGNDVGAGAGVGGVAGAAGPLAGRALGAAWDTGRGLWRGGTPPSIPQNIVRVGGIDVPVSSGQATGDVATQMFEQGALRNALGQPSQHVAEEFFQGHQQPAVEQARANIGQQFDQAGRAIVDNPQAAAEMVGERVRDLEQQSRRNYQNLYEHALSQPGDIHADAFRDIGQSIKAELSARRQPVIIDDVTTPIASRAIQDIDRTISELRIQNRASPFPPAPADSIVGINLQGVDQVRKRLTAMASATERGSADQRAVRAVINEFDTHIEDAIANGLFTGSSDGALDALRQARAAYSQHQQSFRSQGSGDDVGRTMERIVGRNGGDGSTPTEVANWLYGAAKAGGTGLSVRLTQHLRDLLGENSAEWTAIRQGLWSRLTQSTEGVTDFGPARIVNRISEFLNGSGAPLAQTMFSPRERQLMTNFANLQQQLTPRPGTVNYSNTAPMLRMLTLQAFRGVLAALGESMLPGGAGAVAGWGAVPAAQRLVERSTAGTVARSLYQTPAQQQADARFLEQMGRYGTYLSQVLRGGFHPALIGATQAPDGNHYMQDPTRPGKYVRIDW